MVRDHHLLPSQTPSCEQYTGNNACCSDKESGRVQPLTPTNGMGLLLLRHFLFWLRSNRHLIIVEHQNATKIMRTLPCFNDGQTDSFLACCSYDEWCPARGVVVVVNVRGTRGDHLVLMSSLLASVFCSCSTRITIGAVSCCR